MSFKTSAVPIKPISLIFGLYPRSNISRGDAFMHPHVVQKLFFDSNYDLYVLNYKMVGHCRKHGWVKDAHLNSHNKYGTFDTYFHDISMSLNIIGKGYETLLGYAHSTGGPVLLNYLIEKGDGAFDGFIFNSPFLDWNLSLLNEFVVEHIELSFVIGHNLETKHQGKPIPKGLEKSPIRYLEQDIVFEVWPAKIWSLYYFEWGARPLYNVPVTVGFMMGVNGVHRKLDKLKMHKKAVTAKPFLCITSRSDDILDVKETLDYADWIGPTRWEVELNDNAHDVFLSQDACDNYLAVDMVAAWMKNRGFS